MMRQLDISRDREAVLAELEAERPFKSIRIYFDMENHVLSDYSIHKEAPYALLEAWNGKVFAITQVNCGYGGGGPTQGSALLTWLGVPPEEASKWKLHNGISLNFNKEGRCDYSSLKLGSVFTSRSGYEHEILLSDDVFFDSHYKTLYFVNPQLGNYRSLLNAINYSNPREFIYYYGANAKEHIQYASILWDVHDIQSLQEGGFVLVKGDRFDILCFLKKRGLYSVIQNLHTEMLKKPLFHEVNAGGFVLLTEGPAPHTIKGFLGVCLSVLASHMTKKRAEKYGGILLNTENK